VICLRSVCFLCFFLIEKKYLSVFLIFIFLLLKQKAFFFDFPLFPLASEDVSVQIGVTTGEMRLYNSSEVGGSLKK